MCVGERGTFRQERDRELFQLQGLEDDKIHLSRHLLLHCFVGWTDEVDFMRNFCIQGCFDNKGAHVGLTDVMRDEFKR